MQKLSLLADLVDIGDQIGSDLTSDSETVRQRDRQIGLGIRRWKSDLAALRYWVAAIRKRRNGQGRHVQHGLTTLIAVLWFTGLILGWLVGAMALRYDGNVPVNIIHALMILVGSQLLFLLTLLVLLVTCLDRLRESLSFINPALWFSRLIARMTPARHPVFRELFSPQSGLERHGIRQWLLIYLAQHFAIALNLGIIAILFYLVTISDLAFGWSTTLRVEVDTASNFFRALSLPWQWFLSMAAPDADLVESSRYFRLQSSMLHNPTTVAKLGSWWMFMLMCILVYGLMPRIVFLLYAGSRYDRALVSAILGLTGAAQLLSRMRSPHVFSSPDVRDQGAGSKGGPIPLRKRQSARPLSVAVIEWATVKFERRSFSRAGLDIKQVFSAGGRQNPDSDRELIQKIVAMRPEAIVIATASWEPPMMEFIDLLKSLRGQMDESAMRIVFLVPMKKNGKVSYQDLEQWETTLYALDDPNLYIETS